MVCRGDTLPSHTETGSSRKSDIAIDTSRPIQHDGRINVLPATDSPRTPRIFSTQTLPPHTPTRMTRGSFTNSLKSTPANLPVAIDSADRHSVSEEKETEPKKKRVDGDLGNHRYIQEKSIAEQRHLLRVTELAQGRADRVFFKTHG